MMASKLWLLIVEKEASVRHECAEASCRDEAGLQHVQRISAGRLIGPEFRGE